MRDCISQYELRNWYIDGKPKVINCIQIEDNHTWHTCDGYRWTSADEFIGVYLKDVTIVKSKQVGGDHYQGASMQPFNVIDAFGLDFYEGSAVKYLLRWRKKNGVEDLEKAKHYIEILIEREQKNGA